MSITSNTLIEKRPIEKLFVGFDFTPWIVDESTISNPILTYNSGDLIISNINTNGSFVDFFVESGVSGKNYRIEISVVSTSGEILAANGILQVRDQ
jgi:hypothetical protein